MADGPGDLIGHHQPDQDGSGEHEQRHDSEDQHERHLQSGIVLIFLVIADHRILGAGDIADNLRIDRPADQQQMGRLALHLHDGAHPPGIGAEHHCLTLAGLRHRIGRRWVGGEGVRIAGARQNVRCRGVVDHSIRQPAQHGLGKQNIVETLAVGGKRGQRAGEIIGHAHDIGANMVAMLFQIAPAHQQALMQSRADGVVEPGLNAKMKEQRGEGGNDDGGRDRDHTEQDNEPHMQP